MNKMTFRETLVLSEARREDLKYTDKVVKNKVDRVIVELSGSDSATMTKLAGRFERLEKALKTMATKRDELKDQLKEKVTDLFNSDDVIYTRVVETTSFTMTLSKLVKSSEQDPKVVVNYEKIAEELAKLIPAELQAQVEAVTKMYTEVSIAADKAPALRVKSKVDESLNEGILDMIKGMAAKVAKWVKGMATWAVGYDRKLNALKQKAGVTAVTEGYDISEKNREYYDNFNEWKTAVRKAGGDFVKTSITKYTAQAWDGICGEYDTGADEGWIVDKWSK